MSADTLSTLKNLVHELEFNHRIQNALMGVRLIHESDQETFDRILRLACKVICSKCRGYGRLMMSDRTCSDCNGTGNLLPPPQEK